MKVSVIIAAYNAERYLAETLDSVLNQTIDNYEVIVVNDGSSDSTVSILEEYAQTYHNLVIINKENGGPSSARNAGLDVAKGEYIYFFDADDILELDALEMLYDRAKEQCADVVIAKYDIFNRYKVFPVNNINALVRQDEIDKYDLSILWTFSLCNKLFKRDFIEKNALRFPPISYSEDGVFVMRYIYLSKKITGLDKVIFHYRRMYDGEIGSITSFVSPSKIKDYVSAHRMILDAAEESILKDYPHFKSIEEAVEANVEVHTYLNEIIRKELQVLMNQFYFKFWSLDEDSVLRITHEVKEKLARLDMRSVSLLVNMQPDVCLFDLPNTPEQVLKDAEFTVVLYGDETNKNEFLKCLKSLTVQNLIFIKIIVPKHMEKIINTEHLNQKNIFYLEVPSEKELFYNALENVDTPYITFADAKIVYTNNAFKYILKRFLKNPLDYITEVIYHQEYGESHAVLLNRIAFERSNNGKVDALTKAFDNTLANKFFRVDYLKKFEFDKGRTIKSYLSEFADSGYHVFIDDGIVIYNDLEDSFVSLVENEDTKEVIRDYIEDKGIALKSEEVALNPGEAYSKLQELPNDTLKDKFINKVINYAKKQPLKDQVVFFSIRKDKELEGNAKALYPYIKGKKIIHAEQLPHNTMEAARFFYDLITSKVIVTDDYVRYLRHFTVRPEQKVIQLWHGCGAFKKFGQRGTNISIKTDLATHAQYNLVTVSGEYVRKIYADAFGIDLKKVRALGCPRTDEFFDEKLSDSKKEQIYSKYPELRDKKVIVYAPTFRDIGNDRTNFKPNLDFENLSMNLNKDQMFIVCPHPVMKNEIVNGKYNNVKVIRDFSTNDMMFISDMLITDYSSVIFEYALLRKPIAFYCYDLTTYNRGFYLKYPEDLPGDIFENQKELLKYIKDETRHVLTDKYNDFVKKYMSGCDGHSCERISQLINDYMEGK